MSTTKKTDTAGPWRACKRKGSKHYEVRAEATNEAVTGWGAVETTKENAMLIAASPELLAACRVALQRFLHDGWPLNDLNNAAIAQLKKAIAKTQKLGRK